MRTLTVLALLCVAVAPAAAAEARQSDGSPYAPRDLPRIVDPKPVVPNWSFTRGDPYIYPIPKHVPAFTLEEWFGESPTPEQEALAAKLRATGFVIGRHLRWDSERTPDGAADAVVFAFLFKTVSGAQTGFRALVKAFGSKANVPARGLGQQSRGFHSAVGDEVGMYQWRRANLVVAAYFLCDSDCGFSPVPPARAYAGQIDSRAKRAS